MTTEERLDEQKYAINALAMGLQALIDELHEADVVTREGVARRLSRLRDAAGQPIPTIDALAQAIKKGNFASTTTRDTLGVIDGGKED